MATYDGDTELLELISNSRLTGYFAAASLCILLYDHILCFPDEVNIMWGSRWGLAKIAYLWNRYFNLITISLNASGMLESKLSALHSILTLVQVVVREIETGAACMPLVDESSGNFNNHYRHSRFRPHGGNIYLI
ncbi:hypothetical protein B0H13DRAFT_2327578 [Mycena leptocephala]|nr:hypothetical protein B0H13DRAFT_2327578 [Mycena leptocephala]